MPLWYNAIEILLLYLQATMHVTDSSSGRVLIKYQDNYTYHVQHHIPIQLSNIRLSIALYHPYPVHQSRPESIYFCMAAKFIFSHSTVTSL